MNLLYILLFSCCMQIVQAAQLPLIKEQHEKKLDAEKQAATQQIFAILNDRQIEEHYATLEAILKRFPSLTNAQDKYGETVLRCAIRLGLTRAMELLIKANASLDARDRDGQTDLTFAAFCGKYEIVELLVAVGAQPDQLDNKGSCTARDYARQIVSYDRAVEKGLAKKVYESYRKEHDALIAAIKKLLIPLLKSTAEKNPATV